MAFTQELGGADSQPPLASLLLPWPCMGNAARAAQRTVGGVAAVMLATLQLSSLNYPR